eukprot:CAMPEP_0169297846 /NCGR_PEP_ID=MMETSP1016-20121227/66020_1 /TAXON_ID=342587 /ORGANISM="Karlodinium micrum, Strain CCMP2283" /LENGTH=65 /DNA_ID=CAMNT_0009389589 /DNA_START=1 /DNA_END=195 /DNA_ORIENTATION=+
MKRARRVRQEGAQVSNPESVLPKQAGDRRRVNIGRGRGSENHNAPSVELHTAASDEPKNMQKLLE